MFMIHASVHGPKDPLANAATLTDQLWLYTLPDDGVEHIRVLGSAHQFDIVLFTSHPNACVVADLIRRTIFASPSFAGWILE
jgi:hypothetical protein